MIGFKYYDVFNGDADGICALHQLRMAQPRPTAELISGVKRDIKLLAGIRAAYNAEITVLDVSMESNIDSLNSLLANGCRVKYIDHHYAEKIPEDSNLEAHIDPDPNICTSLIVDELLNGIHRPWAIVGAFGDNLHDAALNASAILSLGDEEIRSLRELGELLNYNGYGPTVGDLHFHPKDLFLAVSQYADPFEFISECDVLAHLRCGYEEDMAKTQSSKPHRETPTGRVYLLPAEPWARRASGVFSNEKAREKPGAAHAIAVENNDGTFRISVRAPLNTKSGADKLCLAFPTGGGRKAAAGVNALPPELLPDFLVAFDRAFSY